MTKRRKDDYRLQLRQYGSRIGWNRLYWNVQFVMAVVVVVIIFVVLVDDVALSYNRYPCSDSNDQLQFQFPDCYVPDMNPNVLLSEASFLLSHDAATGYLSTTVRKTRTSKSGGSNSGSRASTGKSRSWMTAYSRTQSGTLYEQLQNGARAFDLRPYLLSNGTIIFQHGIVRIHVTIDQLLSDVLRWTTQNPTELVVLLTSHFSIESDNNNSHNKSHNKMTTNTNNYNSTSKRTWFSKNSNNDTSYSSMSADRSGRTDSYKTDDMVTALSNAYKSFGIGYYPCSAVSGLTVGEAMQLAVVDNSSTNRNSFDYDSSNNSNNSNNNVYGGYVLALDGHDIDGSFCGKMNWNMNYVARITCYPNTTTSCTDPKKSHRMFQQTLEPYIMQCVTNSNGTNNDIGPPSDLQRYPFNEIQALWQVSASSAVIGMSHASSILLDTEKSDIHRYVADFIYDVYYNSSRSQIIIPISLLAVDHISNHGNALYSLLRNTCGQSILSEPNCGSALGKPPVYDDSSLSYFYYYYAKAQFSQYHTWLLAFLFMIGIVTTAVVLLTKQHKRLCQRQYSMRLWNTFVSRLYNESHSIQFCYHEYNEQTSAKNSSSNN